MMIKVYPAESRFSGNHGWLQCNFSFSFADYYDPDNMAFGPLRVFNDDYIQPQNGFGTHPHRDMEIVTFVLSGQLQHKDNTGGEEVLKPGEVQRMTAGTGILHSEINNSEDQVTNSLQLWFLPEAKGLTPSYEQKTYDETAARNALLPVVSNRMSERGITHIHQDLTIYMSRLDAGRRLEFMQESGRRMYLFLIEGELILNGGTKLKRRDAARITDLDRLEIEAGSEAHFMFMDLP
jgi:quercetin 2,3-dioxygenase